MEFLKYCRTHKSLVAPRRDFLIALGGGMAVKLYLMSRGVSPLPKKVADTNDFDFTFYVNHQLTDAEVERYSLAMYRVMYNFLSGFTRMDRLKIKSYGRKSYIPATGKRTYHVVQFGDDFVDCTLAYLPGMKRNDLNPTVSHTLGLPIKKLKYMYKDVMVVLAGSFVYKKIMPRNPLGKNNPEKGLKNTARVGALQKVKASPRTVRTTEFLRAIRAKNKSVAATKARAIIRNISKVKKLLHTLR